MMNQNRIQPHSLNVFNNNSNKNVAIAPPNLVGLGFRVAELQKSEEKQGGGELGAPRWEELGESMKNNIITS
jgi:hypothetical protein